MDKRLTLKQAESRAAALREFSSRQFTIKDLLEIMGRALVAKVAGQSDRNYGIGKHHRARHDQCLYHHPAGTKLVRRFIRRGNSENTAMRKLYAQLTSHQYGDSK